MGRAAAVFPSPGSMMSAGDSNGPAAGEPLPWAEATLNSERRASSPKAGGKCECQAQDLAGSLILLWQPL